MRDYDPTTGRYLQPDPLGLIDGASVYGYVRQNPGRWVDPTGEFGVAGALAGAIGNFALQLVINYNKFGVDWRILEGMDVKPITVAGVLGSIGVSPLSSGVSAVIGRGTGKKLFHDVFLTLYTQIFLTPPILVKDIAGEDCDCGENEGNLGLGDFLNQILESLHK